MENAKEILIGVMFLFGAIQMTFACTSKGREFYYTAGTVWLVGGLLLAWMP